LTTARRADLLVRAETPGRFPVRVEFISDTSGKTFYVAETFIEVV